MISYLEGKIIFKGEKYIVINVNGVGYKVFLCQKSLFKIPEIGVAINPSASLGVDGERRRTIKLSCFLNVRETSLDLYGFLDPKELEVFEIVNNISGIGPKAALEISSLGSLEKIKEIISNRGEAAFEGISGIGRKKAMAIIVELSGKIKEMSKEKKPARTDEAEEALIQLGFSRQKAKEVLEKTPKDKSSEERIKEALKILGR